MAKKNFDTFIQSAGKKPKPTPEEVEAMAKQLHQPVSAPPAAQLSAPSQTTPVEAPAAKPVKAPAPQADAKPKAKSAQAAPPTRPSSTAKLAEAPKEKVRITVDLAKDLYKRMKLAVVENETEISAYIRQLIEEDLAKK